jgi:hypothetical protein
MPHTRRYVLVVQLDDPQRFRDIFGAAVTALSREDIASGFKQICATVLQRYR